MNCEKLSNPSMDKKKKLKHTVNKAKEQSSMENKKKNDKNKSIHDILPLDLIHIIFLRVPIRHLARLRCVSKLWRSLISDPDFAELHFHHSPAATNACFFMKNDTTAELVYLDDNDASQKEVCPPFQKKPPSKFFVVGSCRGFILFHRHPHFLVVWNPLTGSSKRISYSHIVHRSKPHDYGRIAYNAYLHGFGYDASQDDYLLLVAWCDCELQYHLDCFSLRTNSWINHDAAVPKHLGIQILGFRSWHSGGLFFNGAVHWVPWDLKDYRDAIIIFDLMEMTFSTISAPEQMSGSYTSLALLRGCLALYSCNNDSCNTDIWVMKEYKVHSSWTLYQIPCKYFRPLCLSSNRDIIGRGYTSCGKIGYFIYNVRGDLLKHFKNLRCQLHCRELNIVYTESLLPLPSDIKDKDNKKMKKEIGM
ncbi:F-box protein CPR30-like [Arachis ipaensis]|uniref:F-box protein CPR30-like n=1 Tax=Arachis ipaensis TaxID=130454 RepID=UPI0007AF6B32|nr:F-box protein CPR30-like [Arachis ipaensis]XP_029148229.1 F-box protein CPR1-like isoform X1 [Arachis hypogaea]XP_029153900.1 F-box protein CPR1-like isoform X1 [Arachis hypogaea]QHO09578.1 F-box protein [Arachis hypogaea]